jgi:hypothetical protein
VIGEREVVALEESAGRRELRERGVAQLGLFGLFDRLHAERRGEQHVSLVCVASDGPALDVGWRQDGVIQAQQHARFTRRDRDQPHALSRERIAQCVAAAAAQHGVRVALVVEGERRAERDRVGHRGHELVVRRRVAVCFAGRDARDRRALPRERAIGDALHPEAAGMGGLELLRDLRQHARERRLGERGRAELYHPARLRAGVARERHRARQQR